MKYTVTHRSNPEAKLFHSGFWYVEATSPEQAIEIIAQGFWEPLREQSKGEMIVMESTTSEQVPDADALLSLVKDYYAAASLGEKLTDPTYEEERAFQARMIGLIDRTAKLLDLDTGERESGDERIERHGRQWATSLAEQRANASMWG